MFWWVEGFPKELVNEPFFGTQICFRYKSSLSYFIANAIICNAWLPKRAPEDLQLSDVPNPIVLCSYWEAILHQ